MVFLFVFIWDSYDLNVGAFNIVTEVSEFVLISFNSFLIFFPSLFHLFLSFYLLPHKSYLLPLLFYCWFPPECFWSHLLHFLLYWLFFIYSRSLLNLSCILSILVSKLFICDSILISRFWIISKSYQPAREVRSASLG